MPEFILAPIAEDDLAEIWAYIAQDNIPAADHLLQRFIHAFRMLAGQPELGRGVDELIATFRVFSVGNYLIFYRNKNERVEIARILHGARDITPEYFSDFETAA